MRSVRLSEVSRSRENNFDVLRLVGAGLVLVGHSFAITGRGADPGLSTVGVDIFFVISGFLVTKSWLTDPSLLRFVGKRVRRIFPGLICAVAVTAFVAAPIITLVSQASASSSDALHYVISNALLQPVYTLGTLFSSNPYPGAVNGSLWTLPVEVHAYIYLAILAILGLLARRTAVVTVAAAVFAVNLAGSLGPSGRLTSLFVAGGVLYLLRGRIVLGPRVAAVLLVLWLAAFTTPLATAAGMIALPYLAAYVAYCTPALKRVVAKGDVSYGLYLYAFPIQQCVVALLGPVPPLALAAIALPLAWLAGFASWRLVERPILKRRGRAPFSKDEPVAAPVPAG